MAEEQQAHLEDLNDQMLVRREKMEALREEGIDPSIALIIQQNFMNNMIIIQKKNLVK